jgi:hypothetical protein
VNGRRETVKVSSVDTTRKEENGKTKNWMVEKSVAVADRGFKKGQWLD